jgi:xanthine dehydrogenase molybdenum-binding subunit
MGFRKDGRITAMDLYVVQDNGPYGREGDISIGSRVAHLNYTPLSFRFRGVSVLTNTPARGPQRAPGGVQIAAVLEPLMDKAARKLGVDRLAIRRINAPNKDTRYGSEYHKATSAFAREAIDKGADLVNWEEMKRLSGRRNGAKVTGVGTGMSCFIAGSKGKDGLVILTPDGSLAIHTGVGNLGTHSVFGTARAAADVLGMPWEKCEVIWGNTGKHLTWTSVQAGSQTTHAQTRANHAAAMDAKRKLQEIAAKD